MAVFVSMASRVSLLYLLAATLLVDVSQAVVWGPRDGGVRGQGQIQPKAMEIPNVSKSSLSDAAGRTINPQNRLNTTIDRKGCVKPYVTTR